MYFYYNSESIKMQHWKLHIFNADLVKSGKKVLIYLFTDTKSC